MHEGRYAGFTVTMRADGVAWLELDAPERLNGMTGDLKRDLVETLTQAQLDPTVRVVVFTGSGRAFCAGDDMAQYTRAQPDRRTAPIHHGHDDPLGTYAGLRTISQAVVRSVRALDKLSIAAINGVAIQSGFSLALACDFRVASRTARLGSATLRFGLLPDEGGQYLLVQHLGVARAMDFLMRRRIVDADEAHQLGLVHEVVEPDQLVAHALALARELADGPQAAMRLLKRAIYTAAEVGLERSLEDIASKTAVADHHPDAREGVAAWREKRSPRFNQAPRGRAGSNTSPDTEQT